jgi:hypothetical protein
MELIPYFIGLLIWAGTAFGAMLLWPLTALLRRMRKGKEEQNAATDNPRSPVSVPESQP